MDPPFEVKIHKTEVLDEVAPNESYRKSGLGTKAAEGETFVCVQYEVTNKGGAKASTAGAEGRLKVKVSALPLPKIADAAGTETKFHLQATVHYQPTDWKADDGDVEPGKTAKKKNCFPLAKDKTKDLKLVFADKVDGRTWKLETALPAAS